jgi:hypothetical protein
MPPVTYRKVADDRYEVYANGELVGIGRNEEEAKEMRDKAVEKLWESEEPLPGDEE